MTPTIPILEQWTWPLPDWTLHGAYLAAAVLVAAHYVPLLRRGWQFPDATTKAHSLYTWLVWTFFSAVSCTYGLFMLHNLIFLIVVSLDLLGRFTMVMLIVRARVLTVGIASPLPNPGYPQPRLAASAPETQNAHRNSGTTHSGLSPRATRSALA